MTRGAGSRLGGGADGRPARPDPGGRARAGGVRALARRRRRLRRSSEAIAAAPRPRPASPHPAQRWRKIRVDEQAGTIERPPGLQLDSGGVGKGLAADLASELLRGYSRFVVDCGGDMRVGGPDAEAEPYRIEVEHPLTGARVIALRLAAGGVATSGLNVRIWRTRDGRFAHHLLDPATGEPAWTGLVGVTAVGADRARGRDACQGGAALGSRERTRVAVGVRRRARSTRAARSSTSGCARFALPRSAFVCRKQPGGCRDDKDPIEGAKR